MNKKSTLIIGGFTGAGKTTVAARLASDYNYAVFSSDTINDALRDALGKSFKEVSPVAYKVMWHLVRKRLQLGATTVIDAHMAATHIWESLDELKKDMPNVQVLPIILQASLDTHRNRIEERGRTNKEHLNLGGDKLDDVLFKYEFIEKLERPDLVRVDADGGLDDVYSSVEKVIKDNLSQPN
jgi:predicted kinase